MRFSDILTMVIGLLVREKQLSYRFLKREFELDDAALEDLRFELIIVHRSVGFRQLGHGQRRKCGGG